MNLTSKDSYLLNAKRVHATNSKDEDILRPVEDLLHSLGYHSRFPFLDRHPHLNRKYKDFLIRQSISGFGNYFISSKEEEENERNCGEDDCDKIKAIVSGIKLFRDKLFSSKAENKDDLIDEICSIMKFEHFAKNSRVFRYGDYGDKFYIILEGTVSVSIPMKTQIEQQEDDGHEICIRKVLTEISRLTVGQSFGDMALLDYKPRSATIKCLTPCRFAVIPKVEYQKLFGKIQK